VSEATAVSDAPVPIEDYSGEEFGCARCWPASADVAWEMQQQLRLDRTLIDDAHYRVLVLACEACGQRYLHVFSEIIDWISSEDPQERTRLPITVEEMEALCALPNPSPHDLQSIGSRRKSLRYSWPKGSAAVRFWSRGLVVYPHD
jgi:hypothetical protein